MKKKTKSLWKTEQRGGVQRENTILKMNGLNLWQCAFVGSGRLHEVGVQKDGMHNLIRACYWTLTEFIKLGAAALAPRMEEKKKNERSKQRLLETLLRNRLRIVRKRIDSSIKANRLAYRRERKLANSHMHTH